MSKDYKLDALFAEYRRGFPESEAGPDFMPGLWRKIEARRVETTWIFLRLVQACVGTAMVLTLLISTALMSSADDRETFYLESYIDILAADYANDYSRVLPVGDVQ